MKDRTILALKGLAIIGVVYHHLGNRRLEPVLETSLDEISFAFHWCVLAFILVSGYLQAMSDGKRERTLLAFAWTRVVRLLVPFVLLALFYSAIWQLLQALNIPNIALKIPPDFIGKMEAALWPVNSQVAEQLYFFPLLFGVSIFLVLVQKISGIYGMWAAAILAAVSGIVFYPSYFTGFHWSIFVWGIAFYACGYLLFHYRERKTPIRIALLIVTALLIGCTGAPGIVRCVPLWLLTEGATLQLDRVPLLVKLGEASGTIYIYHTPFLVRFLVIVTTLLPGLFTQLIAINLDAWIAIGLCYMLFVTLKNTRAKVLLM